MKLPLLATFVVVSILCCQCGGKYPGYEQTDNGMHYKITDNGGTQVISNGDIVAVEMIYKTDEDSLLFSTYEMGQPVKIKVIDPAFQHDINEAFKLMKLGDSGSFIVSADTFFLRTAQLAKLPVDVKPGAMLHFGIKVIGWQSKSEFEKEQIRMMQEQQLIAQFAMDREKKEIEHFLTTEKIKAVPDSTGLYFIEIKKGTGKEALPGKKVSVEYEGYLLDGRLFDTSKEELAKKLNIHMEGREYGAFSFKLGAGNVIPGWELGIAKMRQGGKARLIIPSHLAYGDRGAGDMIGPYSTLSFIVELVEVTD